LAGATAGYISSGLLIIAANLGLCGNYRFNYLTARDFIAASTIQGAFDGFKVGLEEVVNPAIQGIFVLANLNSGSLVTNTLNQLSAACQAGYDTIALEINNHYYSLFTSLAIAGQNGSDNPNQGNDGNLDNINDPNQDGGTGDGQRHYCSFSSDTQVATDSGEKAIANLKVGDKVAAYNTQTSQVELKAIDAVMTHLDFQLEDLTIDGETLHTTPNHPFYTLDKGWVAAGNLTVGEGVLKADGSYGKVQAVREIDRPQVMYNLTVHDDHDYFVGNGQWLAHNLCSRAQIAEKYATVASSLYETIRNKAGYTPQDFQQTGFVIAVSEVNGTLVYSVNGGIRNLPRIFDAVTALSEEGLNIHIGNGFEHAEPVLFGLYGNQITELGISAKPCSNICQPEIKSRGVQSAYYNYRNGTIKFFPTLEDDGSN